MHRLPRSFYRRDARIVAPELLNKVLVRGRKKVRIVEVEAYRGKEDAGSHAFRGQTPRNSVMFGPPGGLYVYFTYGMHWCANAVCEAEGVAHAVLLRAAAPVSATDELWANRPKAKRERDLLAGPARLCQALGLDGASNGADLVTNDRDIWIADDGTPPPDKPGVSVRIGISEGHGEQHPWRWFVPGDPNLSGTRRLNGA